MSVQSRDPLSEGLRSRGARSTLAPMEPVRDPLINITSAIYDLLNANLNTGHLDELNKHLVTMMHQLESLVVLTNMLHKNTSGTNMKMDELNFKIEQLNLKIDKMRLDLDKITDKTHAMAGSLDTLVLKS